MKALFDLMEKWGVLGDYPKGTAIIGPDNKDTVQPVGDLANPFPHNVQKASDVGGPKGETNMRGEGNQLAAIPADITAKVGPRSLKDTNKPSIKKVAAFNDSFIRGFSEEFTKISGRR